MKLDVQSTGSCDQAVVINRTSDLIPGFTNLKR